MTVWIPRPGTSDGDLVSNSIDRSCINLQEHARDLVPCWGPLKKAEEFSFRAVLGKWPETMRVWGSAERCVALRAS